MEKKDRLTVYITQTQRDFLEKNRKFTGINLSAQMLGILSDRMREAKNVK